MIEGRDITQAEFDALALRRPLTVEDYERINPTCEHGIIIGMLICPQCQPEKQAAAEQHARTAMVQGRGFGRTVEQEDQHLNADGDVCDCGELPPQPGLVHYRRRVGAHSERVAYTPPKYGPPPGFSAEKWRSMSRKARRDALKAMTRAINKTTK